MSKLTGEFGRWVQETQRVTSSPLPTHYANKDVVQCMQNHGYEISQATYSQISTGKTLPRRGDIFIAARRQCIPLSDQQARDGLLRFSREVLREHGFTEANIATVMPNPQTNLHG